MDSLVAWMSSIPPAWGVALVFVVAFGKYVFPPVPTDTVAIVAAFLVGSLGWPLIALVTAYVAGSAVGIVCAHQLGVWLRARERWGWFERFRPSLQKAVEQFRRQGHTLVAANRFIPLMRDFAVIAAGLAEMPLWSVTLCAIGSVAAWVTIVFAIGATAGQNWHTVVDRFSRIGVATWVVFGGAALIVLASWWRTRRRNRNVSDQ